MKTSSGNMKCSSFKDVAFASAAIRYASFIRRLSAMVRFVIVEAMKGWGM